MALTVGTSQKLKGYVTIAKFCLGHSCAELDRILGYNDGALSDGYWFCVLAESVAPDEFAFRGLTHFSGGVPMGETRTTDESLRDSLGQHPADRGRFEAMKRRTAETIFKGAGADRIAKVVPRNRPDAYPPGHGVPQYELLAEKTFDILAEVGPREAIIRRQDGSWDTRTIRP